MTLEFEKASTVSKSSKSDMEPFPSLNDHSLGAVQIGMVAYNRAMQLPTPSSLQREPTLPGYLDPLRYRVDKLTPEKAIAHISETELTYDDPTAFGSHQAEEPPHRIVQRFLPPRLRKWHSNQGALTVLPHISLISISSTRSLPPSRLRAELIVLQQVQLIPHFYERKELRPLLENFCFNSEKNKCKDRALHIMMKGPVWKPRIRGPQDLVRTWPSGCCSLESDLIEEAKIWCDEKALKEVAMVWGVGRRLWIWWSEC
ncbi:hypothetical protein K458DRAFT_422769 [Lentithecium fluviatile CBS 122367]|uniref:Uncharacterized protein n=1 Tax=Lentithecium fluviatile CBS 122367 TaxID=1168545 RepID=A0A6G1IKW0_9PLEO|nr:hypothetical protein K458DRAFT_422769 [Lentithecium fluviatile CBS 122367]